MGVFERSRRVVVFCSTGLLSVSLSAAAQPPREWSWRGEAETHGAWLPGGGERAAVGAGLGAGYGPFSAGIETWRYWLTLEDSFNHERLDLQTTLLGGRVGARFELGDSPVALGGTLGLGLALTDRTFQVGRCANQYYGGRTLFGRAFLGVVWRAASLSMHVGFIRDDQGASGDVCLVDFGPGPDPERRDLPWSIPYGAQLGLTLEVAYPAWGIPRFLPF